MCQSMSRVKWIRLIDERQKFCRMLWLILNGHYTLTWKIIKALHVYTDFVMVNIALNLHSYEEN